MSKKPKTTGSNLGGKGVMQQIHQLQEQMIKAQEALAVEQVIGSAGGGAVQIIFTGNQQVLSVRVDPSLLDDGDVDMLQDLILTAIKQGLELSQKLAQDRLGPLAGQGLPF
jgi:DNA-binding YbaB/EbfC family protein